MAKGFKNDSEAQALWASAYDAIPKSVFAVACWHLADLASDDGSSATERMAEEVRALALNGLITEAQAKSALKHLVVAGRA